MVSGTWHCWKDARLIQPPGDDSDIHLTPDETRFLRFATTVGFKPEAENDHREILGACQTYLEDNSYQVWTARDAVQLIRDSGDTVLASRLMERLINWYFLEPLWRE
jgi:hypothetical protein